MTTPTDNSSSDTPDYPQMTACSQKTIVELLMSCALSLSTMRRLNIQAGYAFREPPNIDKLIKQIDFLCSDEPRTRQHQVKTAVEFPPVPVFIFNPSSVQTNKNAKD